MTDRILVRRRLRRPLLLAAAALALPLAVLPAAPADATTGDSPVSTQPAAQTVVAGQSATFDAAADCECSEQWQVSTDGGDVFVDVAGATGSPYTFTAAATDDGSEFRDVFTPVTEPKQSPLQSAGRLRGAATADGTDAFTTDAALLTVDSPPVVTVQPQHDTMAIGGRAYFRAAASGKPTPEVQWQISTNRGLDWSDVPNAQGDTLRFPVTLDQAGASFRAVFTNDAVAPGSDDPLATAISRAARLTVLECSCDGSGGVSCCGVNGSGGGPPRTPRPGRPGRPGGGGHHASDPTGTSTGHRARHSSTPKPTPTAQPAPVAATTPELPDTGGPLGDELGAAAVLLLAGAALQAGGRRRSSGVRRPVVTVCNHTACDRRRAAG